MKTPTTPCLRCEKTNYVIGKTLETGTVCKSCAKYFQIYESCSTCRDDMYPTSNRTLPNGEVRLLCDKCYSKHLPVCHSCGYRRKALTFTLEQKPLCKFCSIEGTRKCIKCKKEFPAGQGRTCQSCHYQQTLDKKVAFIANSFTHLSECFVGFSKWLLNRRGLLFTATHIQNYQLYFYQIDELYEELQQMPSYEILLNRFRFATSKKYFLIHTFLDEQHLIKMDENITEKYSNFNLIEKQLEIFNSCSYKHKLIYKYYQHLCTKLPNQQIALRSIRLALTPAIKFLQYCENFQEDKPTMKALEGYLWLYSGQRATIAEFINFLKNEFAYSLQITKIPETSLKRPRISHQILRARAIKLMRNPQLIDKKASYFYTAIFGYLHWISIPINVFIAYDDFHFNRNGDCYIRMCGHIFNIPEEIYAVIAELNHKKAK